LEDLECWQEARKLVNMVYDAIRASKPFQNDYRLKDQSSGSAVSVMENIPEGFVRRSNKEFIQFLFISVSSAAELQSHMYVRWIKGTLQRRVLKASMIRLVRPRK
jgi:four helix bundle protein